MKSLPYNEKEAKRQGLRGNEVEASKATGFVIDAAKAAGTTVAAIGTAAFVGWGLSELDKRFKITDNLKKGANSLIKGMRGWFK